MITTLAISGYRSIREIVLPLKQLTVITGRNGTGKSSFYRALRLLAEVAQGRVIASLAAEGGLPSTLWAGPEQFSREMKAGRQAIEGTRRKKPVALRLGFAADDYGYAIDLGMPVGVAGSMFNLDPEVKTEAVWIGEVLGRRNVVASRRGPAVMGADATGRQVPITAELRPYDSMMTQVADPRQLPELLTLRERMRGWRFYDHFRTDVLAPARQPAVGTRTPVLAPDGSDLAAAVQTIIEIGDGYALDAAVEDAFPGSELNVAPSGDRLDLLMQQHGLLRPLGVSELSDGTLRYLLLLAALLTPRPPSLMVLNEPETSLHPELLQPLGRLIGAAGRNSQIIVVTHARPLVEALAGEGATAYALEKRLGETVIDGIEPVPWEWPTR